MAQITQLNKWFFGPFLFKEICKVSLLLISLLSQIYCFSQNIILNGGFEVYELDKRDSTFQFSNWTKLLNYKLDQVRFSDYSKMIENDTNEFTYNSKKVLLDYYRPYEGDGAFQSVNSGVRSFYQQILNEPLHKDSVYHLQFKYKVGSQNIPIPEVVEKVNKVIGVVFTKVDFRDSLKRKLLNKEEFNLPWQFHINNFSYENKLKWMTYDTIFQSNDNYKFVIFGHNEFLTDPTIIRPYKGISYLIDNISLTKSSQFEFNNQPNKNKGKLIQEHISRNDTIDNIINKNIIKNDSVNKYYYYVSKAENLIIKNKNKDALEEYLNAFEYKVPFYRDYFNASHLITHFKIIDSLLLKKFFILSGKISSLTVKDRIEYLQSKDPTFNLGFLNRFKTDTCFNKYKNINRLDSSLIKQINNMIQRDQDIRTGKILIKETDSRNLKDVLDLYKNNDEISERTVGKNGMTYIYIMILHFSRYNTNEWIKILFQQVMLGNFDNRVFASLIDSYIDNNFDSDPTKSYYLTSIAFPHHDKYIIPKIDITSIEETDKRRKQIYLETVTEQQNKQLYNYRQGYENFEFYQFFSYDPISPDSNVSESEALEMQKKFIEQKRRTYPELIIKDKQGFSYDIDFK